MISMNKHTSVISNLLVVLQILLLFCSFVEPDSFPNWLTLTGRLHPLLLHLPVSLVLLNIPVYFLTVAKNQSENNSPLYQTLLAYTALLATLTAFAGLFLASGGEYDEQLLLKHKWLSIGVAILSHLQLYLFQWIGNKRKIWTAITSSTAILMIAGSHYGGTLTHGEDFLTFSVEEKQVSQFPPISDKSTVFDAAVAPIIATKCSSCHNASKQKGGLNMTDFNNMFKGGKTGALFVAGNPNKSLLIERILLAMDDKKHMPPKGKAQLTPDEMMLFTKWIEKGGSNTSLYHSLEENDSLKIITDKVRVVERITESIKTYSFKAASPDVIESLNSPFRRILPISANSPALSVKFFLKEKFNMKMLEECNSIKQQVVEINLSGMPVDDQVIPLLTQFENLEKLNLNSTQVTGKNLKEMIKLKHLNQLSLTGTAVDATFLNELTASNIKTVYLWNTKIKEQDLVVLKKSLPNVKWDLGYIPDKNEMLKLTPPKPTNTDQMIIGRNEAITLKHPLPGVTIKYTLDGSIPDSINGTVYTSPILSTQITRIIAIATRDGWISSTTSDYTFFQQGIKVDSIHLIHQPNEKYKKNGKTTLTDLKKGFPEILNLNWLGYKEQTFKTGFYFTDETMKSTVVLSAADNTGAYVFPPTKITVWGGDQPKNLKKIGSVQPAMPTAYRSNGVLPYLVPIEKGKYKYIEIEAQNILSLPSWHGGKGGKGWVFVDEVFFY